jgi:hypothetical protein
MVTFTILLDLRGTDAPATASFVVRDDLRSESSVHPRLEER